MIESKTPSDRIADLEAQVAELRDMLLKERFAPPAKFIEPSIVFADGTTWNPGAGRGYYMRSGRTWVKL